MTCDPKREQLEAEARERIRLSAEVWLDRNCPQYSKDWRRLIPSLADLISRLVDDAVAEERRALLMLDRPWSLRSIVEKLSAAVLHLLYSHDCDGHGWEEFDTARREINKWLSALDAREKTGAELSKLNAEGAHGGHETD